MALEPSLWGTLPEELLHLVFARLPIDGIGQLPVLSKEWKKNIDCKDSEFNHVLNATNHLNTFAVLPWVDFSRYGNIYDVQANRWHVYKVDAILNRGVQSMDGVDGGLVCFLSNWSWDNKKPMFCYVMNPLTKQKRQLPPLLYLGAEKSNTHLTKVRMVKFTVDKETKEYKVFVLSSTKNGDGGFFAQVYDSHIKKWTVVQATQGHVIGYVPHLDCIYPFYPWLSIYNFTDGTLKHFDENDIAHELEGDQGCCVLVEDHLFILHKVVSLGLTNLLDDGASVLPKYCISEFYLSKETTTWVKLRVHSCGPCKLSFHSPIRGPSLTSKLLGCNGFLLVYGRDGGLYGSQSVWLYNLSTCEWRILPNFPEYLYCRMMCTISWSAIA